MKYSDKLLDPRWQKKRLEVLQRDDFTCMMCRDKKTTLHVHHFCYAASGNPWDSDLDDLITYCECCHCLVTHLHLEQKDDFIIYAVKKTLENSSVLMCLTAFNEDRGITIYEYKNKNIRLESVLTFKMVDILADIVNRYRKINPNTNG